MQKMQLTGVYMKFKGIKGDFKVSVDKEALELISKGSFGKRESVQITLGIGFSLDCVSVGGLVCIGNLRFKINKVEKNKLICEVLNEQTNKKD